jgi:hypothetical protein
MREVLWELNGKTIESGPPVFDGHGPFLGNIPEGQVKQLEYGILIWKGALRLEHLSEGAIERLNCVSGVGHPAAISRIGKERNNPLAMPQPQATDGGVVGIPLLGKGGERIFCLLKGTGLVDALEVSGYLPLLLPGDILEGIADQVGNAQRRGSLPKGGASSSTSWCSCSR